MKQLIKAGMLRDNETDPTRIHHFRVHTLLAQAQKAHYVQFHAVKKLEVYARSMGYLVCHVLYLSPSFLLRALIFLIRVGPAARAVHLDVPGTRRDCDDERRQQVQDLQE